MQSSGQPNILDRLIRVSILTRPEGRMQCHVDGPGGDVQAGFQSSPGQKAGCNAQKQVERDAFYRFQSSPGQKAGCNPFMKSTRSRTTSVSILTRPEGRMQLHDLSGLPCFHAVSILTRPEGRMQFGDLVGGIPVKQFQSSPGQKAGCNCRFQQLPWPRRCFNPHPARRPDAIRPVRHRQHVAGVSILTRPEGRMQYASWLAMIRLKAFQSSPGQKAGCNRRADVQRHKPHHRFQSSPGQKAGCN